MKYLKKFATEAEVDNVKRPGVVLLSDTHSVKYLPPYTNGVYIQHINGNLYTTDAWVAKAFANDEANGVAIISDETAFVIAKADASNSTLRWGGTNKVVKDIVTSSFDSDAALDYDGVGNTPKIIEQLSGYNDGYVTGAPAAEACANYVFPNGEMGHLPSLGEWLVAENNKAAIVSAMTLIGGKAINTSAAYWSSTQAMANYAWGVYWGNSDSYYSKYNLFRVRAFSTFTIE